MTFDERTVTASSLGTFLVCPRKYQFNNIMCLWPVGHVDSDALTMGSAWHKFMDKREPFEIFEHQLPEQNRCRLVAMMQAYKIHYGDDSFFDDGECEQIFTHVTPIPGYFIAGIADVVCEDRIIEHKTTSDISDIYVDMLTSGLQRIYMWAFGKNKMMFNAVRKPSIRLKQKQTPEEYVSECVNKMVSESDNHFLRQEIILSDEKVSEIRDYFYEQIARIRDCADAGHYTQNMTSCIQYRQRCAYYPLCHIYSTPEIAIQNNYVSRPERRHEELNRIQGGMDNASTNE